MTPNYARKPECVYYYNIISRPKKKRANNAKYTYFCFTFAFTEQTRLIGGGSYGSFKVTNQTIIQIS